MWPQRGGVRGSESCEACDREGSEQALTDILAPLSLPKLLRLAKVTGGKLGGGLKFSVAEECGGVWVYMLEERGGIPRGVWWTACNAKVRNKLASQTTHCAKTGQNERETERASESKGMSAVSNSEQQRASRDRER